MSQFKSSAELKASAREHLLGHYGTAIGAYLLAGFLIGIASRIAAFLVPPYNVVNAVIYYAITFFLAILMGLFQSGLCFLYLKLICGRPVSVGDLFYGFQLCPDKAILIQAWITLVTFLASLPRYVLNFKIEMVILNGNSFLRLTEEQMEQIMKYMLPYSLSLILAGIAMLFMYLIYGQAFFLLHDFPQYSAKELLKKSRRLMVRHKGRLFYLYVSFIPLLLLGCLSGIALLWVLPYMAATEAEFFLDLIRKSSREEILPAHKTEAAL